MWTGISALLARAMQMDARKLWTHVFRLAFVMFIYFSLLSAQVQASMFGAPGHYFLQSIVFLNAVFISLAGVSFFASAITEEKEEKTLGLLQMAGIGPMSVLLGKSTSRLIQALMLLLVQFPFTLLSITLGGVTMHQVVAAYAALAAFLIGLSNLALFWSVVCRRTGSAAGLTTLLLAIYFISPFLAEELHSTAVRNGWSARVWYQGWTLWLLEILMQSQVFLRLSEVMETSFAAAQPDSTDLDQTWWNFFKFYGRLIFSTQVITNSLFGLFCFLMARLVYGPCTQDVDQVTDTRGMVLRSSSKMKLFSSGRCWGNPLVWKDFHFLAGGYSMAIVKWFLYGGMFGLILAMQYYGDTWRRGQIDWEGAVATFAGALCGFLVLEAAIMASRVFHDEIRMQTMSSLLMLPRSVAYIGYSKAVGCAMGLLPAVFWLICCGIFAWIDARPLHSPYHADILFRAVFHPAVWSVLLGVSIFVHLTTLLSLFVRWGALPLAILLMIMMACTCPALVAVPITILSESMDRGSGEFAATLVITLINLTASFVLQMMIGARLQEIGSK